MEIRSEVSAPARLCPQYSSKNWRLSSLLILISGGRGYGRRLWAIRGAPARLNRVPCSSLNGLSYGGLCPHPPRNLRFLGFSFRCRLFGRTSLLNQTKAQAVTTTAQRRQSVLRPHQKCKPSGQAATKAAQPASPKRGSSCVQAQPATAGSARTRLGN